ncbi:MAG: hypothetical protein ABI919_14150, partial [Ramlibacter sp.]
HAAPEAVGNACIDAKRCIRHTMSAMIRHQTSKGAWYWGAHFLTSPSQPRGTLERRTRASRSTSVPRENRFPDQKHDLPSMSQLLNRGFS